MATSLSPSLAGILLTGIGAGIAFSEYSQFTYGGEVVFGTEKYEVETTEYVIDMNEAKSRIMNFTSREMDLVEDKTLKDGQVKVEVVANTDYILTYVDFEDYRSYDKSVGNNQEYGGKSIFIQEDASMIFSFL